MNHTYEPHGYLGLLAVAREMGASAGRQFSFVWQKISPCTPRRPEFWLREDTQLRRKLGDFSIQAGVIFTILLNCRTSRMPSRGS